MKSSSGLRTMCVDIDPALIIPLLEVPMFTKLVLTSTLLAVFAAPLAANAGEVQNRINDQHGRINQGVRNASTVPRIAFKPSAIAICAKTAAI